MSKIRRGGHSAEGETLSAGRVEYLEAARARVRTRRIRRTVIIVAVLTILVLFATGAVGSSIARAKDLVDTAVIALAPAAGWPQQTGITDPDAVAQMSGSFVEMGGDSCVVYSLGGTRLNSIQSGYAGSYSRQGQAYRRSIGYGQDKPKDCGWKAAPRTFIQKPWTAPSRCAPWQMPDRWLL